jgi:BACON domain-containing protein
MDEYPVDASELPDEYAALADTRQVMLEVVGLLEDLHKATTRLGDAIAAAGFHGREWRGLDAQLDELSDQFPEITLDDLITRLAEFSAGNGPAWLRGDHADIERFNDEAAILGGVMRPLRVLAQRQRVTPARERSRHPFERALADGRVGTQLDLMARYLRDLEALAPFIAPLAPEEWNLAALAPQAPPAPKPSAASAARSGPAMQRFTRLRDFAGSARGSAPSSRQAGTSQAFTGALGRARAGTEVLVLRLRLYRWMVVVIAALILAIVTGLLTLAVHEGLTLAPPSHLQATPAQLTLSCTGRGATQVLTLHNTGSASLTWQIAAPAGLTLSAAKGLLTRGASATVTVKVSAARAARGTLAFTSTDGAAQVPYTVTCQ